MGHKQMKQQHGSALIISLLILLVMTIIGISAMSNATLEEKMAANDRNHKEIFQNAESSLRQAENTIAIADYNGTIRGDMSGGVKGYYNQDAQPVDYLSASAWDPTSTCIEIANNSNGNGNSCYIVKQAEVVPDPGEIGEYGSNSSPQQGRQKVRITVRSTNQSGNNPVIVQSNLDKIINF